MAKGKKEGGRRKVGRERKGAKERGSCQNEQKGINKNGHLCGV